MSKQLLMATLVSLTMALAAPALGQDDPPPEDEEISTLKGQLVPVGEQNKYKYSYQRHLVSTNPLNWFFGTFGVGYTWAFHRHFALRAEVEFLHIWKTEIYGGRVSASMPIYFKKMHDGFYLEPGAYFVGADIEGISAIGGGPMLLLGWSWIWDSGFNVNFGLGMTYTWLDVDTKSGFWSGAIDGPWPTGRLAFGYAW